MNILDLIKNNLSGDALGQLSSLVGASPELTQKAAGAAVPAMLAGMSKLAETGDGASRLTEIINNLDPSIAGNLGGMFSGGGTGAVQEQGSNLLGKLFGGGVLASLVGVLEKFTGGGGGMIKKLLAFLTPLILGSISKQFGGKASAQGLTQFFSEQKGNITNALPAGLSLASIPGLGNVGASVQKAAQEVTRGASAMTWLLPALLIGLAVALWLYFREPEPVKLPPNPDLSKKLGDPVVQLTDQFNEVFGNATKSLEGITDAATAEKALPDLAKLTTDLDEYKKTFDTLPDVGKSSVKTLIGTGLDKLKALIEKAAAIPGVGDKLKPVIDPLLDKLNTFVG